MNLNWFCFSSPRPPPSLVLQRMSATTSSCTARTEGRATTTCAACAPPRTRASCARSCAVRKRAAAAPTRARARPRAAPPRYCCRWPLCWGQPAPWGSRRRIQPPDGSGRGEANTAPAFATNIGNPPSDTPHSNTVYKLRRPNWTKPYITAVDSTPESRLVISDSRGVGSCWYYPCKSHCPLQSLSPIGKAVTDPQKERQNNNNNNKSTNLKTFATRTWCAPRTTRPRVWTNQTEASFAGSALWV